MPLDYVVEDLGLDRTVEEQMPSGSDGNWPLSAVEEFEVAGDGFKDRPGDYNHLKYKWFPAVSNRRR